MRKSSKKITQDLKITNEELKKIQTLVKAINNLQMQIGNLEVQKSIAVQRLHAFQRDVDACQLELKAKYGDVSVNLQDGILKPIPRKDE